MHSSGLRNLLRNRASGQLHLLGTNSDALVDDPRLPPLCITTLLLHNPRSCKTDSRFISLELSALALPLSELRPNGRQGHHLSATIGKSLPIIVAVKLTNLQFIRGSSDGQQD